MAAESARAAASPNNRGRTVYVPEEEWRDILRFAHVETRSASGFVREACKQRCREIMFSHLGEGLRGR